MIAIYIVLTYAIDLDVQRTLKESNYSRVFAIQDGMSKVSPELNCKGNRLAELVIGVRIKAYYSELQLLEATQALLEKEARIMNSFTVNRSAYVDRMKLFMEAEVARRRQNSLQKELETRKQRIEQMRDMRLAAIKAVRDAAIEVEKERLEKLAAKKAIAKKTMVTKVSACYNTCYKVKYARW